MTTRRKSTRRPAARAEAKGPRAPGAWRAHNAAIIRERFVFALAMHDAPLPTEPSDDADDDPARMYTTVRVTGGEMLVPHGSRLGLTESVGDAFLAVVPKDTIPADGGHWIDQVLSAGSAALLEAAAMLLEVGDLSRLGNNTLTTIGDTVSKALRRRVLLGQLQATDWNLTHTAERLRMGSGTGNVLRAIRELGLEDAYRAAGVTRGRKTRVVRERAPKAASKKRGA